MESVVQFVVVRCTAWHIVAQHCSALQGVAACCSVCCRVCCSVCCRVRCCVCCSACCSVLLFTQMPLLHLHKQVPRTRTGWPRPVGCLKLQVIVCKRATKYRALLRKMTYKDKASYGSLPPCIVLIYIHYAYSYMYVRKASVCVVRIAH